MKREQKHRARRGSRARPRQTPGVTTPVPAERVRPPPPPAARPHPPQHTPPTTPPPPGGGAAHHTQIGHRDNDPVGRPRDNLRPGWVGSEVEDATKGGVEPSTRRHNAL